MKKKVKFMGECTYEDINFDHTDSFAPVAPGRCPQTPGILCGRDRKTGGCKDHILTVLKIKCSARV